MKRLEKGYGIKEKCTALNISKFKLEASAKDFTPILLEWPKGRIFSINSLEQFDIFKLFSGNKGTPELIIGNKGTPI